MLHEQAKQNLIDVVNVLNEVDAYWWLEAGTCLAAIREGKFIDHDSDVDFGIFGSGLIDEITKRLLNKGFYIWREYGTKENGYEVSYKRDDVKVDIFCFYQTDKIMWHSAWLKERQLFLDFPGRLFAKLKSMKFLGVDVFVPNPPEEYLELRYGDWKQIKKQWDWAKDPLCLRK